MPRIAKELTAIEVNRIAAVGMNPCGNGLYLNVSETGSRSWILRITIGTKRRSIGLGGYPATPLKEARDKARKAREMMAQGIDPIEQKKQPEAPFLHSRPKKLHLGNVQLLILTLIRQCGEATGHCKTGKAH